MSAKGLSPSGGDPFTRAADLLCAWTLRAPADRVVRVERPVEGDLRRCGRADLGHHRTDVALMRIEEPVEALRIRPLVEHEDLSVVRSVEAVRNTAELLRVVGNRADHAGVVRGHLLELDRVTLRAERHQYGHERTPLAATPGQCRRPERTPHRRRADEHSWLGTHAICAETPVNDRPCPSGSTATCPGGRHE